MSEVESPYQRDASAPEYCNEAWGYAGWLLEHPFVHLSEATHKSDEPVSMPRSEEKKQQIASKGVPRRRGKVVPPIEMRTLYLLPQNSINKFKT